MRATSPLRNAEDISQAIELFYRTNADSVVSVVADPTGHPIRLKMVDEDMRLTALHPGEENSPIIRQNLPLVYRRNGAIYVTKISTIQSGSLFGNDCRAYIMPKDRSVNINDEVDFIYATALLEIRAQRGGNSSTCPVD
jgi:CMP-N-acetylneuraminic acid synthetase